MQQVAEAPCPAQRIVQFDTGDAQVSRVQGTRAALKISGIDVGEDFQLPCEEAGAASVVGADGFTWKVWGTDWFALQAERPRTDAERVQWIDHANARIFSSWFSADRVRMCRDIAHELYAGSGFNPDRPLTRAARRDLKRELRAMAEALSGLCMKHGPGMAENRALLASAGIYSAQRNFSA